MLRQMLRRLKAWLPQRLPTGMKGFEALLEAVVSHSGLPDNGSTRNMAAAMIMSLPPTQAYVSVRTISNRMVKAAANQIASAVLKESHVQAKA